MPYVETVKKSLKTRRLGMMSSKRLSDLHPVSCRQPVTADNNVGEVLQKNAASAMQWTKKNGPPTRVKLLLKMSRAIFQQDGVRAQHA